jgi:hypothetical protein
MFVGAHCSSLIDPWGSCMDAGTCTPIVAPERIGMYAIRNTSIRLTFYKIRIGAQNALKLSGNIAYIASIATRYFLLQIIKY